MNFPSVTKAGILGFLGLMLTIPATAAHATAVPAVRQASAGDGTITCQDGVAQWSANPGISFASRDVRFDARLSLGRCAASNYPGLTNAEITLQAAGRGACPWGITQAYGKAVIRWDNGDSSDIAGNFRVTHESFGITDGRVTSGIFRGDTVTITGKPQESWAGCVPGLTQGEGVVRTVTFGS
jgi:hypothetical protein